MGKLEIAQEYLAAPAYSVDAVPAFKALAKECTVLALELHTRGGLTITEVSESEPYPNAKAMFADLDSGKFKVSNLNCRHPQWTAQQNINFRIVHDVVGHWMAASKFTWKGELAAYHGQRRWHSQLACEALYTEIVGQTACYSVDKVFPAQKVILLESRHDDTTNLL